MKLEAELLREVPVSPGNAVHRVLVGGRNQEADGRHRGLAALVVQHPPLEGLRVVEQSTFISSVHRDLQEDEEKRLCNWLDDFFKKRKVVLVVEEV